MKIFFMAGATSTPVPPNFLNFMFMQFFGKFGKIGGSYLTSNYFEVKNLSIPIVGTISDVIVLNFKENINAIFTKG